nr:MAG TPA: hypothetical protein [Caudoviricetes sp.]
MSVQCSSYRYLSLPSISNFVCKFPPFFTNRKIAN